MPQPVDAINRVLTGDRTRRGDPAGAVALFREAADAGDAEAASQLAVLSVLGLGLPQDFAQALAFLVQSAEQGGASARPQLAALAGREGEPRDLAATIDLAALLAPPVGQLICEAPRIVVFEGFATRAMCDFIIADGRERLEAAKVGAYDGQGHVADPVRTATSTFFDPHRSNLVVALIQERVKAITGLPIANHEPPNLISYEPGQEYKAHYDFVPTGVPAMEPELNLLGQRIGTCLTYLNDDYEGGETRFLKLNWQYRGRPGDALLFHNTTPDGQPDGRTLHAGTPVINGRKYILSKWLRGKPLPVFR